MRAGRLFVDLLPAAVWAVSATRRDGARSKNGHSLVSRQSAQLSCPSHSTNVLVPQGRDAKEKRCWGSGGARLQEGAPRSPAVPRGFPAIDQACRLTPSSPGARAARWQNYDDINEYFWTEGCIKKEHSLRLDAQYVTPGTPDEEKKSKLEIWCAHHLSSSEGAGKSEPMF